jgi:hypothetical protein
MAFVYIDIEVSVFCKAIISLKDYLFAIIYLYDKAVYENL